MSTAMIAPSPANVDTATRVRAARLLRTEIHFIANHDFANAASDDDQAVHAILAATRGAAPVDMPAHLRGMCQTPLLSKDQETTLFRSMNRLKYRANVRRSRIDPATVTESELDAIETLLEQAQTIRDHIIQANMRLVMSIVKKFVTPQQSFDELLSDGIDTLMQTVEKFDYDRGFRFSTYAYRSIARDAYRTVTAACKEEARITRDAEDWAFELDAQQSDSLTTERVWSNLREVMAAMLKQLDRRERFIVRSRYALGAHRHVRTFQYLADKLGVSKERARQLEQRAVMKLQQMASLMDADELFAAAMV